MTKEFIGYKVVDLARKSLIVQILYGGRTYHTNKKIVPRPNCGPLCVFKTIVQAQTFKHTRLYPNRIKIVKCKYEKSSEAYVWSSDYKHRISRYHINELPRGTVLADSVTCLE